MTIQDNGRVGIGTMAPTAKLDVDGVIRGKTPFAYVKDHVGREIPSAKRPSTIDPNLVLNIIVKNGDIVLVQLSPTNLIHSTGGTCYMKIIKQSGSATILMDSDWVTSGGVGWGSGATSGIYKATADGNLQFRTFWHGDPAPNTGTCGTTYRSMYAYVIGKA
tara:strand:+ start:1653 stop:2138 length:486 start_codon:yes stop_codon:yes gene_type:complete